jgi:hypothetical protein
VGTTKHLAFQKFEPVDMSFRCAITPLGREIERRGVIFCFFQLPHVGVSPLELLLGCGSAFQYVPCSADQWVTVLLQPLLYKGNNKNPSSIVFPCLSDLGERVNYSDCRRGDSTCVVRWCSPLSFLCLSSSFLFVACYSFSLMFVGVAVQANAVQQCLSNEWKQESYYKETILEREQTERLVYP